MSDQQVADFQNFSRQQRIRDVMSFLTAKRVAPAPEGELLTSAMARLSPDVARVMAEVVRAAGLSTTISN